MIKQKTPYGCGMYAVANSLNLESFCSEERLEKSKGGNTIGQLSKWLLEDDLNINIDALFYDHHGSKIPEHFYGYTVSEAEALPLLFNVRYCEDGKNHLVAGRLMKTGELLIFDSLKEEPIISTIEGINSIYHQVYGMHLFMDSTTGNYIFLN